MTTENENFDAEAFVEEGMEAAGIESDEQEQEAAENEPSGVMSKTESSEDETGEKPAETDEKKETSTDEVQAALEATETEEETEEEVESPIAGILPQAPESEDGAFDPKSGKWVPVEKHAKMRGEKRESDRRAEEAEKRAQDAERKVKELEQQRETETPTGGEKPGEEVSPLDKFLEENPQEELVPAIVQRDERDFQEAKRQKQAEAVRRTEQAALESQRAATQQLQDFKTKADRATSSEKEFRKVQSDYEAVTKKALDMAKALNIDLLNDAEGKAILNADNPAKEFHKICRNKLDVLGIPSTPTSESEKPANEVQEEPDEDEQMTDDEIFEDVYGED